jgi:hypothetical protein
MKITAVQQVNSEAEVVHSRYSKFGGKFLGERVIISSCFNDTCE